VITHGVVYYTKIDVSQEFPSNVCNFLMLLVIFDSFIKVLRVLLTHLHKVNTDAVIRESFAVYVSNSTTYL
jgi:hypothetical protein